MQLLTQCLGAQPHLPLNSVLAACAGMLAPERFRLLEEAGIDWAPVTTATERTWQLCLGQLLAHRRTPSVMQVSDMACEYLLLSNPSAVQRFTGVLRTAGRAHRQEQPASEGLAGSTTAPLAPEPASSWPRGSVESSGRYTGFYVSKLTDTNAIVCISFATAPLECMLEQL